MPRFSKVLFVVLLFSGLAFTQTPSPKPSPLDDDVVKISTNIIQLDVSVTDNNGKPISDIKPDEIQIYENGKRQDISNFSFVRGARNVERTTSQKSPASTFPANLPERPPRPEAARRTIALVVDDLSLSFETTIWVREALKKFVEEQMQDGDLVAIIRTGAGIGALQQFTTDKRQLMAAIEKVKFNYNSSATSSAFNPITMSIKEELDGKTDSDGNVRDYTEEIEREQAFEREQNEFRENIFATGTLGALNFIVRGMKDLPGRKSIMLLSNGIKLTTRDDRGLPQPSRISDSLRRLIDFANRSSVVVYTLDARGLVVPMPTAEDDITRMTQTAQNKLAAREYEIRDNQEGLVYLAKQTGGFAIINQNDISKGIRRVLDDQSYYLIAYEPDSSTFDAKLSRFNKIEVKVSRPGTQVRYRSGFYGISNDQITNPVLTAQGAILRALTSPFALSDISLRMNPVFAHDQKIGSYLKTFINIDPLGITFSKQADGRFRTAFDLMSLILGDSGTVVDERGKGYVITLDEQEYKRFTERGLVFTFVLPVKKHGGYQVRLAVRDATSGRVGFVNQYVEVPNVKKNRLLLSGAVLNNSSSRSTGQNGDQIAKDPQWDTAVRQFNPGSDLRFAYDVYNAHLNGNTASLRYIYKLYRDNELVFDSGPRPANKLTYESEKKILTVGGIKLGTALIPGDYVLLLEVIDDARKGKGARAIQFIQFELIS